MTMEYTVDMKNPDSGNYVVVVAKLYGDGEYEEYEDIETGSTWVDITGDPSFYDYTYEDAVTGAIGVMPDSWKESVDLILCNIYWDRELNR